MLFENIDGQLAEIVANTIEKEVLNWLAEKVTAVTETKSVKDLYLTYSLLGSKVYKETPLKVEATNTLKTYIEIQNGNAQQLARILFLRQILKTDGDFFISKVANIIQVADTSELETFLKFLIFLPNPEQYKTVAVDALRTNISTVFNAIAFNNPYPAMFFSEQQWNQMYLKTAFMQGDLSAISDVDQMANKDLARIISDYAHERWAAGRDIDADFWRPVANFLDDNLLEDMKRLLSSDNVYENRAAALCLFHSNNAKGKALINLYPNLISGVQNKEISWNGLKS